jgi:hypothetical protein
MGGPAKFLEMRFCGNYDLLTVKIGIMKIVMTR